MPVDDEDKRRSVAGVPMVPDGTIDAEDRRHVSGVYRGPLAGDGDEVDNLTRGLRGRHVDSPRFR